MKKYYLFYLLLVVFLVSSCKHTIYLNKVKFDSKVIHSFQAIDVSKHHQNIELKISSSETWKFRLTTPKINDGDSKPLVIAMHWAGNDEDYKVFSKCLIEPGLEALDAFIICPSDDKQLWYSPLNIKKVLGLVGLATSSWKIDSSNIMVMGYSNGGNGTWYFAEHYANIFSFGIPMASAYEPMNKISIPLYAIHGQKDELFPIERTRRWVEQSRKVGSEIKFVVAEDLSHYEACQYVSYLKKAIECRDEH